MFFFFFSSIFGSLVLRPAFIYLCKTHLLNLQAFSGNMDKCERSGPKAKRRCEEETQASREAQMQESGPCRQA